MPSTSRVYGSGTINPQSQRVVQTPVKVLQRKYNPFTKRMDRGTTQVDNAPEIRKDDAEFNDGSFATDRDEERKTMGPLVSPESERPSISLRKSHDSKGGAIGLKKLANEPTQPISPKMPKRMPGHSIGDNTKIDIKGLDTAQSIKKLQRELQNIRIIRSSTKNEISRIQDKIKNIEAGYNKPQNLDDLKQELQKKQEYLDELEKKMSQLEKRPSLIEEGKGNEEDKRKIQDLINENERLKKSIDNLRVERPSAEDYESQERSGKGPIKPSKPGDKGKPSKDEIRKEALNTMELQNEINRLKNLLEDEITDKNKLAENYKQFKDKMDDAEKVHNDLKLLLEEKNKEINDLNFENKDLNNDYKSLQDKNNNLLKECQKLRELLSKPAGDRPTEAISLEEYEDLKDQLRNIEADRDDLEKKVADMWKTQKLADDNLKAKEQEIKKLRENLLGKAEE